MRFTKMHGLGNDFLVVDDRDRRLSPGGGWAAAARRLCDRRRGIGADGVLLLGRSRGDDLRMRLFNADGSEAEMCGNGIRCLALWALDAGIAGAAVRWETGAGTVRTEVLEGGLVRVDMGPPRFEAAAIPVDAGAEDPLRLCLEVGATTVRAAAVGMGNPHCVVIVDSVAAAPVERLGPLLEVHPRFPRRTNVEFVEVLSRARLRQRTHERGVGETDACGTGACAAAVALHRLGLVESGVTVELRGGPLRIDWAGSGGVLMTGPAARVFEGEVALEGAADAAAAPALP